MAAPLPATPILPIGDMPSAHRFYRMAGFDVDAYDDGYAFVMRGGREVLHLAVVDSLDVDGNHSACYLHDPDVEAVHARWRSAGLPVTPVEDKPWGMREFSVRDPAGNLLRVGTNV